MATSIAKLSVPAQTPKTPSPKAATTPSVATLGPATKVTVGKPAQTSVLGLYGKTGVVTASPVQKPAPVVTPPAPAKVTASKVVATVAAATKPATTAPPAQAALVAAAKLPVAPAAVAKAPVAPAAVAKAPAAPAAAAKAPVTPVAAAKLPAAPVAAAKAPAVPVAAAPAKAPEQASTKVAATPAPAAKAPAGPATPAQTNKAVAEPASQTTTATSTPNKEKEAVPQPMILAAGTAGNNPPAAQDKVGTFVADGHDVVVDVNASESWFDNRIYWSTDNFATRTYLATDNQLGSVNLGRFDAGTVIQFGIDNGQGDFFRTGSASGNADGLVHAQVASTGQGTVIGFEDTFKGGDRDYNDAVITVRNAASASAPTPAPTPAPVPAPAPAPSPPVEEKPPVSDTAGGTDKSTPPAATPPASDKAPGNDQNRSGLGDGTNPGQGAGRENSSNGGTQNPHNV